MRPRSSLGFTLFPHMVIHGVPSADWNAVGLIATVLGCVLAILAMPKRREKRGRLDIIPALTALLVLGFVLQLILGLNGTPKTQWIIPTICLLSIWVSPLPSRTVRTAGLILFVIAMVLSVHFLVLVHLGYTGAPAMALEVNKARQETALFAYAKKLRATYPCNMEFPHGPVGVVFPELGRVSERNITITREWHTFITGLWKVGSQEADIWYPGGILCSGVKHLTVVENSAAVGGAHPRAPK